MYNLLVTLKEVLTGHHKAGKADAQLNAEDST